jgi:hypothetical protein
MTTIDFGKISTGKPSLVQKRLKSYTGTDFLRLFKEMKGKGEDIRIVDRFIKRKRLSLTVGASGSAKSIFMMLLAICIANKMIADFFKMKINLHGKVLWFDNETGLETAMIVYNRLCHTLGIEDDGNIKFYCLGDHSILLTEESLSKAKEEIRLEKPVLCIFDCFSGFLKCDENDIKGTRQSLILAKKITIEFDTHINFIHHMRKPGNDSKKFWARPEPSDIRGASSIRDVADQIFYIEKCHEDFDSGESVFRFYGWKERIGQPTEPFQFKLIGKEDDPGLRIVHDGMLKDNTDEYVMGIKRKILEKLHELGPCNQSMLLSGIIGKREKKKSYLDSLVAENIIQVSKGKNNSNIYSLGPVVFPEQGITENQEGDE